MAKTRQHPALIMSAIEDLKLCIDAVDAISVDVPARAFFARISFNNYFDAPDIAITEEAAWQGRLRLLSLCDDSILEVASRIPDKEMREKYCEYIVDIKKGCILSISSANMGDVKKSIKAELYKERLSFIIDVLSIRSTLDVTRLDRQSLFEETVSLMAAIDSSDLPEYAKVVTIFKLNSVCSLVNLGNIRSDSDIRNQVKAVVADFLVSFEDFDGDHASIKEKIVAWGKRNTGFGIAALAIGADVATVFGLLEGPVQRLLLPAPTDVAAGPESG